MNDLKKILFPVDFSEVSPKVVPYVQMMAKRFEAEIHILFVVRNLQYLANMFHVPGSSIENFEVEVLQGAEGRIEEFAKTHFKENVVSNSKVVQGDPAETILEYIKSERMDLVIIGTHGRKGLDRVFFGSVADRVIKMSTCPVLSINPYRGQDS